MLTQEKIFGLYDQLIGDVDLPAVLREVAEVVCREFHAERATVYVIDEDTQELRSVGVVGNVSRMIRIPISETSLAGYCALSGRAFVVEDAYGDLSAIHELLSFDRRWDEANGFRTRDVMCCPATFKGGVLGAVQAINSRAEPFGPDDLAGLQGVSRLIGYALYHARLYEDLATMKRLEQEKAQFMRIMVHELKSPVAAVKTIAEVLVGYGGLDEQAANLAGRITGRMDDMIELINDMLDLAKAKAGGPMGRIDVLDLAAETRGQIQRHRPMAEQKDLALHVELPDAPLPVRFDSKGLALVVSNLLSNAVKYTLEGAVRVSLTRQDGWAELTVADTGIGIPEKDLAKLFREFFRASNAKKNRIGGSGVGLALVKQMVERFGGRLTLASRENEGSTFTVRFPIAED